MPGIRIEMRNIREVLQADEAPETFAALGTFQVGVKSIKGFAVGVGEAQAVIFDLETPDLRQAAVHLDLAVPLDADRNVAVLPAGAFDGLKRVDHHLDNR